MTEQSAAPVVHLDPSDIFSMMVVSDAFDPRSASIEERRRIFGRVWARDIPWLLDNFDSTGRNPQTDSYGFGFLVEAFARNSNRLPRRNTEKGEVAARQIISELHRGRWGRIGLDSRQSNSDFLWVELTGRRITVVGIGEVKSSYQAAKNKIGGQLKRQETSLGYLIEKLETAKTDGSVCGYFQKRGIAAADPLEKFLIVPFGEGESARRDKEFADWKVVEIEYSYNELIFVAQQIWPDFRPDIKIGPGKLANLDQIAVQLKKHIFGDMDGPFFELGLFLLATGKSPSTEEDVEWSVELIRESYWPAIQRCLNFFMNSTPRSEINFSDKEKALFKKFWYVLTSDRNDLEHFIYFIRSLNAQIKDLAISRGQFQRLKAMSEETLEI